MVVVVAVVVVIVVVAVVVIVVVIVTVVVVTVVVVVVIVVVSERAASRSIGRAVGVDDLDVLEQPVERLGLAELGLQVADGVVALVGLADLAGLLAHLHAMRSYSASRSSSVASRPSAAATARSARSTLTAFADCAAQRLDERPGSWPVACSHCSSEMPCGWNCCTVFCTRCCRSPLTIASGGSMSTSSASADGGPRR